jgi:hypothetical protein
MPNNVGIIHENDKFSDYKNIYEEFDEDQMRAKNELNAQIAQITNAEIDLRYRLTDLFNSFINTDSENTDYKYDFLFDPYNDETINRIVNTVKQHNSIGEYQNFLEQHNDPMKDNKDIMALISQYYIDNNTPRGGRKRRQYKSKRRHRKNKSKRRKTKIRRYKY